MTSGVVVGEERVAQNRFLVATAIAKHVFLHVDIHAIDDGGSETKVRRRIAVEEDHLAWPAPLVHRVEQPGNPISSDRKPRLDEDDVRCVARGRRLHEARNVSLPKLPTELGEDFLAVIEERMNLRLADAMVVRDEKRARTARGRFM